MISLTIDKEHAGVRLDAYVSDVTELSRSGAVKLIESGETASVAAYRVGFGDYSSFYRAYVKIVGHAPTSQDKRKEN